MSRRGVALLWPALTGNACGGARLGALHSATISQNLTASQSTSLAHGVVNGISEVSQLKPYQPTTNHRPGPPSGVTNMLGLHPHLYRAPHRLEASVWRMAVPSCGFSISAAAGTDGGNGSRSSDSGGPSGAGGPDSRVGSTPGESRVSLGEALNQLVDAAIAKVEAGEMDEAVSLLKDGLNTFEPVFPNSPELGELHNQAALLLLFQGRAEESARHAQASLETTKQHFGARSLLTAHRLLRLGVCRFALGKMADAADLLRESLDLLDDAQAGGSDPGSRGEGGFYLDCVALTHVKDPGGVEAVSGSLRSNLRAMKEAYGADSMILSLALAQHSRLVNGGLEQADFSVGEALLKQQISLLGEVTGADSEDAAVARYKLGTYYYANEMLTDAGSAVQQAAVALRAHYPEEHDLLVLCKHRLGMICAAQGDHRAAVQLLQASRQHFAGEGGQSMLAKEADIGLAMARFRAVDAMHEGPARHAQLQQEALEQIRAEVETLAQAISTGHMLVQGAARYYKQFTRLLRK